MDLSFKPKSKTRTLSGSDNGGKDTRRRAQISIMDKVRIIQRCHSGESASNIAMACGIGQSTVCEITQAEAEIMETLRVRGPVYCETHYQVSWPHYGRLEYPLRQWLTSLPPEQLPVDPHVIQEKAVEIAEELGLKGFVPSKSWMNRFHKKNWKYCGNMTRGENNTRRRHNSKPRTSVRHPSGISPPVHPRSLPPEVHLKDPPTRQCSEDFPSVNHQIQSPPVYPQFRPENHRPANRSKTPRKEQKQKDNKQSPPSFYSTEKPQNDHQEELSNFDSQHTGNVSSFSEFRDTIQPQNIISSFKSISLIKMHQQFASTKTTDLPPSPKNKDKRKKTKTLEQITEEILHGSHFFLIFNLWFCCHFADSTYSSRTFHMKLGR